MNTWCVKGITDVRRLTISFSASFDPKFFWVAGKE
jgi:hypothetical protein